MFAYIPYELTWLQKLLTYRPEVLNPFFVFLNNMDKGPTYCLIAIMIFTLLHPRLGMRCFVLLAFSIISNYWLKHIFEQPRPLVLDPSLALVQSDSRFGLPSGAAEASTALAVFIIHYYKQHWVKVLSIIYVVLICISRVYIGMHFISDIIVGVLIGYLLGTIFVTSTEKAETTLAKVTLPWRFGVTALMMAIGGWFAMPTAYSMGLGLILGVFFVGGFTEMGAILETSVSLKRKLFAFGLSLVLLKGLMTLRSVYPLSAVFYSFLLVILVSLSTYVAFKTKNPTSGLKNKTT
jgi:membrane-associated phospholipid phosphatase